MTDNEIIKALECCHGEYSPDCNNCPNKYTCDDISVTDSVLDLITRQKAEIERLQSMCQVFSKCRDDALREGVKAVRKAKSEAIKEFAKVLKENTYLTVSWGNIVTVNAIDILAKEMTGEQDT